MQTTKIQEEIVTLSFKSIKSSALGPWEISVMSLQFHNLTKKNDESESWENLSLYKL